MNLGWRRVRHTLGGEAAARRFPLAAGQSWYGAERAIRAWEGRPLSCSAMFLRDGGRDCVWTRDGYGGAHLLQRNGGGFASLL